MRHLLQDLRYAMRMLGRAPGFTIVAVLSLALGIGANTAIFSLVYAVLLKPLPFREPARLITTWDSYLPLFPKLGVSPPELESCERQTDLFEQTAWYRYVPKDFNLVGPGAAAVELHATIVSPGLLPLLGAAPALGRAFSASGSPQTVLLNDRLWKSRFGGSRAIIGQSIRLEDREFTIAGVMPPEFQFPKSTDIWLPPGTLMGDELTNPVRHAFGFIARLRPGVTAQQASVRLETAFRRLAAEHPKTSAGFGVRISGLQEDLTRDSRPALLLLLGAVALVLLIACGNVANLLLSRGSSRRKEIAIRTALGASAGRLIRQLLTESILLAAVGGGAGLALAAWSLAVFSPIPAPLDSTVLWYLLAVSLATGMVFGLAPALQARKIDPISAIKTGPAGSGQSSMARGAVVVLEFAFALMVVIGAGILGRSLLWLLHVDGGFSPHGVLTLRISPPPAGDADALFRRIAGRLRPLPGIESVAAANTLPLIANRASALRFHVPGSPLINPDALPVAQFRAVSPEYFGALRIPLRSGRVFDERDLNQPVAIINVGMARRFWPGRDPVGIKFVTGPWGPNPNWSTIIGVAGDVKQFGLDSESSMDVYFPSLAGRYLILRTAGEPGSLAAAVEREIQASDRGLAISEVRTMDQISDESTYSRRWTTGLLAGFAGMALVLALVGIYGVTSWAVAQRTREIGIRMALGADRGQVLRMVLRYGARLCGAGLAIGLGGALALRRVLSSLAFGVSTADPAIYGGAVLLLVVAALLACYLPARRASRVAPLAALRWE
ncbi:MAG: ABC transporter permease [Acidobacteriia bacterium]|nr:ABC transporter permease [Terriglobia bacterium]